MSLLLRRAQPTARARDRMRLLAAIIAILAAALAWRAARPVLIRAAGRWSVGCEARNELVAEALRALYPASAPASLEWDCEEPALITVRGPMGASVVWVPASWWSNTFIPPGWTGEMPNLVADEHLVRRGLLCTRPGDGMLGNVVDRDGDSRVEAIVWLTDWKPRTERPPDLYVRWHAIIRLGPSRNEVLALIADDVANQDGHVANVGWRAQNPPPMCELTIREETFQRATFLRTDGPSWDLVLLAFEKPGGRLVYRQPPTDTGVACWLPAAGELWDFDVGEPVGVELDEIIARPSHDGRTLAEFYAQAAQAAAAEGG